MDAFKMRPPGLRGGVRAPVRGVLRHSRGTGLTCILDELSTAAVGAWSVARVLAGSWSRRALIRLRRTGDDVESDFGADPAGELDIAAVQSWIGGSSASLVAVYDQSGGGNDLTQATGSSQPVFAAGGLGANDRPGFTTTGTLHLASSAAAFDDLWAADGFAVHIVWKPSGTITDNMHIVRKAAGLNSNWALFIASGEARMTRSTTGDTRHKGPDANLIADTSYAETLNSPVIHNGNATWRRNGYPAALGTQNGVGAGTASDAPYDLQWPASVSAHPGQHSELALFSREISTGDLQALNSEATSYFGT